MKFNKILETAAKTFAGVKLGGKKGDPKLAELDRGVLTVGLLVAALDGTIQPEEYAAFETLAKKCRGGSAKNVRTILDAALPLAGQLMAMAQVGVYSEKERVAAFLAAAEKSLPRGFADGSMADVRRAFALWVTMGLSDGTFCSVEKAAVEALRARFAEVAIVRAKKEEAREERLARLSPAHAVAYHNTSTRRAVFLEPEFIARAEKIARDLAAPAKRAKAEAALDALIATMPTADD